MNTAASEDNDIKDRHLSSDQDIRAQFVAEGEAQIKKMADELPEAILREIISRKASRLADPTFLFAKAGGHMQNAVLTRCMHAVDEIVRSTPQDRLMPIITAPSDYGVLVRILIDSRYASAFLETDPLAGPIGRSIEHRKVLLDMAGEMLTSSQVEDLLHIKRQALDKRRNANKLLALRIASDWHYPAFQFTEDGVLPLLEQVLQAHSESDPWAILDILLAPDEALRGRTLLQAVQDGDEQAVARHIAQENGDGFA